MPIRTAGATKFIPPIVTAVESELVDIISQIIE